MHLDLFGENDSEISELLERLHNSHKVYILYKSSAYPKVSVPQMLNTLYRKRLHQMKNTWWGKESVGATGERLANT